MAQKRVYCNVAKHRVIDKYDGKKRDIEDVSKIGLPTIKHTIVQVKSNGMIADVDMPDTTHLDAMDFTIYHNNGTNCEYLSSPGQHEFDVRIARQQYNVPKGELGHEGNRCRVVCVHSESQKGDVETGNPLGTTEKFALLRYEEYKDNNEVICIDVMAGTIRYNGKEYTSDVDNLLK